MGSEPEQRVAVIDLGSNSFRMVVFEATGGSWRREDECSSAVRIGEGLATTGRLSDAGMARALRTLDSFAELCRRHGLDGHCVDAVATSAIRDAENGSAFLEQVRRQTGFDVRVLSREQEARYGYLAAINSTTLTQGCVLDLGGGSLQLVRVAGRLARESGSWRLGAVRMTERFLAGDGPAKRSQVKALQAHVSRKLERAPWLPACGPRLIGLGGTVRNLAAAAERAAGLPSEEVQGFVIEQGALEDLIERLAALAPSERSRVPGIKQARADIVLAGALVIQGVMRCGEFTTLEVTGAGLREGIFFERQLVSRQPSVLLAHSDGRIASSARAA
ncbi:MAG TPA: Ppx/GppA family phosphatase [Solirubrobacteraceae bacterium]|jgi:exopolyphosphatase/guanosine-5'-triphosphate,3'-diphosphate pyrophosphatase|nr:Ppx/GppA family phosphatase [Solirubrobacteraceae bacterium]